MVAPQTPAIRSPPVAVLVVAVAAAVPLQRHRERRRERVLVVFRPRTNIIIRREAEVTSCIHCMRTKLAVARVRTVHDLALPCAMSDRRTYCCQVNHAGYRRGERTIRNRSYCPCHGLLFRSLPRIVSTHCSNSSSKWVHRHPPRLGRMDRSIDILRARQQQEEVVLLRYRLQTQLVVVVPSQVSLHWRRILVRVHCQVHRHHRLLLHRPRRN
uniref:Putative secreted peptide n=1 Tax=Anopheles braziliensis TaxID=58242 RepID=A0A2M3ZNI4_9DIPT